MLGGFPMKCPCKSAPYCSCWPPLPQYRSGVPGQHVPDTGDREVGVRRLFTTSSIVRGRERYLFLSIAPPSSGDIPSRHSEVRNFTFSSSTIHFVQVCAVG